MVNLLVLVPLSPTGKLNVSWSDSDDLGRCWSMCPYVSVCMQGVSGSQITSGQSGQVIP